MAGAGAVYVIVDVIVIVAVAVAVLWGEPEPEAVVRARLSHVLYYIQKIVIHKRTETQIGYGSIDCLFDCVT